MSKRFRQFSELIIFCSFMLALFYLSTTVDQGRIDKFAGVMGWGGPVLLWLCILTTQVFAFLSSTPFIIAGIRLYGYGHAILIFYAASMTSAVTNFWLARLFGRPLVRRLVGPETMAQIDVLTKASELSLLIVARVFGYFFIDILGYTLGLTTVPFRKYMTYTATLTLIPLTVEYSIFRHMAFDSLPHLLIYYGSLSATGLIFIRVFYRVYIGVHGLRER